MFENNTTYIQNAILLYDSEFDYNHKEMAQKSEERRLMHPFVLLGSYKRIR